MNKIRTEVFSNKMWIMEITCVFIGLSMAVLGYREKSFNFFLLGIGFVFVTNIIYSLIKWKSRFIVLIFYIMLFTFCLGKPLIGMLAGEAWWNYAAQANDNIWFALKLILCSLIALQLGTIICDYSYKKIIISKQDRKIQSNQSFIYYLQLISLCMYFLTMFFFFMREIEPLMFIKPGHYLEYYSSFESKLPAIFHTIASFMKYSLCLFLATLPSKRKAFIPLVLFELSAVPSLIIGVRNPIMLNSIFILIYYLLRDILQDEKKWMGNFEKCFIGIMTPFVLVFMGMYSYIREGLSVQGKNLFFMFLEFFKGQGVTFDAMTVAYGYRAGIESLEPKNYTFGGFIDYILHGTIGQKIFGTSALPAGNNVINGIQSNNFSHNFSYVSFRDKYLEGHGRGSSYMLETYFDFGYVGVVLFSLILAILMVAVVYWFGKKVLASTIFLVSLTTVFFIPRAEATGWLTFLITLQFWLCVGVCYLGAYICSKCPWIKGILKFLRFQIPSEE